MIPAQVLPLIYKMAGQAIILFGGLGALVAIDFQDKITLGSVIVTVVVIIVAGIFTVRSKIANIWREEAEGERAAKERCQEELAEERAERAAFEKEQQELRHALKNEIVGLQAQIRVLEMKTDLTAAVTQITGTSEMSGKTVAQEISAALAAQSDKSEARDKETQRLLQMILDKLPAEPLSVTAEDPLPVHEVEGHRVRQPRA